MSLLFYKSNKILLSLDLNKKISRKKFMIKNKSYFLRPSMTFEVILHLMKNLRLYNVNKRKLAKIFFCLLDVKELAFLKINLLKKLIFE